MPFRCKFTSVWTCVRACICVCAHVCVWTCQRWYSEVSFIIGRWLLWLSLRFISLLSTPDQDAVHIRVRTAVPWLARRVLPALSFTSVYRIGETRNASCKAGNARFRSRTLLAIYRPICQHYNAPCLHRRRAIGLPCIVGVVIGQRATIVAMAASSGYVSRHGSMNQNYMNMDRRRGIHRICFPDFGTIA